MYFIDVTQPRKVCSPLPSSSSSSPSKVSHFSSCVSTPPIEEVNKIFFHYFLFVVLNTSFLLLTTLLKQFRAPGRARAADTVGFLVGEEALSPSHSPPLSPKCLPFHVLPSFSSLLRVFAGDTFSIFVKTNNIKNMIKKWIIKTSVWSPPKIGYSWTPSKIYFVFIKTKVWKVTKNLNALKPVKSLFGFKGWLTNLRVLLFIFQFAAVS